MKRIVALIGVRGAGKSTLLRALAEVPHVHTLQPTTDRPARDEKEEYDFVAKFPRRDAMAWQITVGEHSYGVRNSKVKEIPDGWCGVTVFDPGNLGVLEKFRREWSGEVVTIGLDTITTLNEQRARVGNDESRQMSAADFESQLEQVRKADIVLRGNATTVLNATKAVCELLVSRGGLVGKNWLVPLIAAEALLDGANENSIEPASYDLRLGSEVWCQGERYQLTEEKPFFRIPPYSYAIVKAEETAKLPCFMAGRFDLKVSLFFKGVLLSNGPQVDPGYHGALFCMLFNGRDVNTDLKMGEHFATLEFCTLGSRIEGYAGQYQAKERLNQFQAPETGAGPGGNIVGRVNALEKEARSRLIAVALLVAGLIAAPSALHVWLISSLNDRANVILNQVESDAKRDISTIVTDLPLETKKARESLLNEVKRIDEIRAENDALNQRIELLEEELKRMEERRSRLSDDVNSDSQSTAPPEPKD
jgi:deoxycytidine triphosphate deaminase/guanylate kinase